MKRLNIPNSLTAVRFIAVPFFIYLILQPSQTARIVAFIIFALASLTDLVDGYLARKLQQETELGRFMDPLADKALVLGAFITFLFLSEQIQTWMVLCIVGRDMLITVLRYLAIRHKKILHTSHFGKIKTVFQMISIFMILLSFLIISYKDRSAINALYSQAAEHGAAPHEVAAGNFGVFHEFLFSGGAGDPAYLLASFGPYYLMLFTTIITLISGLRYFVTNYRLFYLVTSWNAPRRRRDVSGDS